MAREKQDDKQIDQSLAKQTPLDRLANPPENAADQRFATALTTVSDVFGVSYDTVRKDWRAQGMPVMPDGRYDLAHIGVWYGISRGAHDRAADATNPATEAALIKRHVDIKLKEEELKRRIRENELREGGFVRKSEAERLFATFFGRLRDDLARVPGEMASSYPKSVRRDLVDQLKSRLNLVLTTLHRQRRKIEELAEADI